ncbi:MAG: 2-oxoacid:acceptor oxidoreductase subunit alpha [Chlorobium sp.]|nr:MAG: 2-oxoacid:acceptor oxidoreductase subunit alpha [Chlorobium sp.]
MYQDISMVFSGAAGQGVQTITGALLHVLKKYGCNVFSCSEYMSRIRGGSNSTEIRITEKKRDAYVRRIDMLFALSHNVVEHLKDRISSKTLIFAEKEKFGDQWGDSCIDTPLTKFAVEAGSAGFSNIVAAGVVLGMFGIPLELFTAYLQVKFAAKGEEIATKNCIAAKLGYSFGRDTAATANISLQISIPAAMPERVLMDGSTALGIGAVAAGCNFISSYPMSPGTGLLTFLANRTKEYGIVVDQAEDEIAAINAGLGASYAGARAIVTTSGGGFDLMQEGVSLAGMIETPIVIHIGQRPGPATGLPTRTEQGDLNLALHAGHGDFARVIFSPGTLAEIIDTTQQAFNLAQRYQIPVFILTDQYLLESVSTIEAASVKRRTVETFLVKTTETYQRYAFTDDGLSPRGVPGYGDGLVRVDSDEHDENGLITESFDIRRRMVEKRLNRIRSLMETACMPTFIGSVDQAETLVISWGSNRWVLEEALDVLGNRAFGGIHFSQVFPLNPVINSLFENKRLFVMENNATGQFADLLSFETGRRISRKILKATGEPFTVEEVVDALHQSDHE